MTTRETSCIELDYTEEDHENIDKVYEILETIFDTMRETKHDTWDLESCSVSSDDVGDMLQVLGDLRHYNVLR